MDYYQLFLLEAIDKNFEQTKAKLIEVHGDPGHDIGDATTALELLHNLTNQGHDYEAFARTLQEYGGHDGLLELFRLFEDMPDEQLNQWHVDRYGTTAWNMTNL